MLWMEFGGLANSFFQSIPTFGCMIITVVVVITTADQLYLIEFSMSRKYTPSAKKKV